MAFGCGNYGQLNLLDIHEREREIMMMLVYFHKTERERLWITISTFGRGNYGQLNLLDMSERERER